MIFHDLSAGMHPRRVRIFIAWLDGELTGRSFNPPLQTLGGRGPLEAEAERWQSLGAPLPERQTAHRGLRQDRAHKALT